MKKIWVPIAAVCMLAAIVLVIRLNFEAAFVVAAIGTVAWFLNYRQQVKTRLTGLEEQDKSVDQGQGVDEKQNTEDSLS
jgi:membrane protein implicated in regulation of membrane protease activity